VSIKNTGSTPAYDIRHYTRIAFCSRGAEGSLVIPKDISSLIPTSIGPGAVLTAENGLGRALSPAEITLLSDPLVPMLLCVYGKITYRDAFGTNRETTYRLVYAGVYPVPPNTMLLHAEGGGRAT
jgi:hypothetical protein